MAEAPSTTQCRWRGAITLAAITAALVLSLPPGSRAQTNAQAPLIEAAKTPTRVRPAAPAASPGPAMAVPGIPTMPSVAAPPGARLVDVRTAAKHTRAFKVQLASAKTARGAAAAAARLRQRYSTSLADVDLKVEKAPRGDLYRVVSPAVGDRRSAGTLCAAIAAQHGSCLVVATAAASAAPRLAAAAQGQRRVRAQLASLRSFAGATREADRLSRRYGAVLDGAALTVSRVDQAGRGTFYRVLTPPLRDRDAAGLCQHMALQAGCVLVRDRHRSADVSPRAGPGAGSA